MASACSNWRFSSAVRASLSLIRAVRRSWGCAVAFPLAAAAPLGRAFLISSDHLGRRVVEQSPLDVQRLGLVDLLLGHVIVAQEELLPRFVEQPPTPLLDVQCSGGVDSPEPDCWTAAVAAGAAGRRSSAGAAGGWPAVAGLVAHDRFCLGQLFQIRIERRAARRVGADRDKYQRPASTWRPVPSVSVVWALLNRRAPASRYLIGGAGGGWRVAEDGAAAASSGAAPSEAPPHAPRIKMRLTVISLPNATSFRRSRRRPPTSLATAHDLSSRVGDQ